MARDDSITKAAPLRPNKPPHLRNVQPNELNTFETLNPSPENSTQSGMIRRRKRERKKGKTGKAIAEDPEPSQDFGDPSEDQDGIEDSGDESTNDSDVITVRRRIFDRAAIQDNHS